MSLDGRCGGSPTRETVDAVVVGTGAGGAPLLARLAAGGLRVVALEAGQNHDPEQFTADELDASKIYWLGERLSAGQRRRRSAPTTAARASAGRCCTGAPTAPRPDPRDLRLRSDTGAGEDWPFELDELLPFLRQVEQAIGVSGPADYPWDPGRRYPLPPVALNAPAQAMQAGCAALGIRTVPRPSRWRRGPGPRSAGASGRPASTAATATRAAAPAPRPRMDVTYLPQARGGGGGDPAGLLGARDRAGRGGPGDRGGLPAGRGGPPAALRRVVPVRRRGRDAAPAAAHGPGERQRPGRPELHGARRDPGLGHVRAGDAAATRATRRR